MIYYIASRYKRTYQSYELFETMVQELFLVLHKISSDSRFTERPFVSTYLGMESRRVRREWLDLNRKYKDVDGMGDKIEDEGESMEHLIRIIDQKILEADVKEALKTLTPFERWCVQQKMAGKSLREMQEMYNAERTRDKKQLSLAPFHSHTSVGLGKIRSALSHQKHYFSIRHRKQTEISPLDPRLVNGELDLGLPDVTLVEELNALDDELFRSNTD